MISEQAEKMFFYSLCEIEQAGWIFFTLLHKESLSREKERLANMLIY